MVDEADRLLARNDPHTFLNPAPADDAHDFNRDKKVNATDELIVRHYTTTGQTALKLITASESLPAAALASVPGDADGNKVVDIDDYAILIGQLGRSGEGIVGDFNGDGRVGLEDFAVLRSNFGLTRQAPVPVPVPAAAPMAALQTISEPIAEPIAETAAPAAPMVDPPVVESSLTGDYIPEPSPLDTGDSDDYSIIASVPVADLLVESLSAGEYVPESQPTLADSPQFAATTGHDLRPLSDELSMDGDYDLLTDILAESSLAIPL